jgi:hypothetical protein
MPQNLPEFIVNKLRQELAYPSLCQRITVLSIFLDKLSKTSHPYDRLCGKLFGMSGEKLISTSTLRQHLKFREFIMKVLRVGRSV